MMTFQVETPVHCPYCGESITLLIDPSVTDQRYVEDCAVCCRPIQVLARVEASGAVGVEVWREDDG